MTWGIDYASIDGNKPPDLAALKAAGCEFVWLRATYDCTIDQTFLRDWAALAHAGFVRGAYGFPLPGGKHTPQQFATALCGVARASGLRRGVDFPLCIDVEFPHGIAGTGLDRAGVIAWIRDAVLELKRQAGCWPIIYTSGRVWNGNDADCLGNPAAPDLTACPLWLARYLCPTRQPAILPPPVKDSLPVPSPWDDFWIAHQDQGDALRVPGLTATADVDRFRAAHLGDRGGHVKYMQGALDIAADGIFGPVTAAAGKTYQTALGLPVTGAFDLATFCSLAWR